MAYGSLEELEVFRAAERICDRVYELVREFPQFDRDTVGGQLVRAADSIGANIAESYGRFHYGEQIQLLYYARGSLYEAKYWLRRCGKRRLLSAEVAEKATTALDDLAIKLNAFIRSVRQSRNGDRRTIAEPAVWYADEVNDDGGVEGTNAIASSG